MKCAHPGRSMPSAASRLSDITIFELESVHIGTFIVLAACSRHNGKIVTRSGNKTSPPNHSRADLRSLRGRRGLTLTFWYIHSAAHLPRIDQCWLAWCSTAVIHLGAPSGQKSSTRSQARYILCSSWANALWHCGGSIN